MVNRGVEKSFGGGDRDIQSISLDMHRTNRIGWSYLVNVIENK